MFTVKDIRDTLSVLVSEGSTQARALLPYVAKQWQDSTDNDLIIFDVPPFFKSICDNMDIILKNFKKIPQGLKTRHCGLTVQQIGKALDKMGEPWPDYVIAQALQLQLLASHNKLFSLGDIMGRAFA